MSLLLLLALLGVSVLADGQNPPAGCAAGNLSSIVAHDGDPTGKITSYSGYDMYATGTKSDTAVVYLTDVFGIQLPQNKLLADSFARAGFFTIAPDLFGGSPAPSDIMVNNPPPGSSFNATDFLLKHNTNATDPIAMAAIDYARKQMGARKVAVTGYCFGGRYAMRALAYGDAGDDGSKRADVGFAAHPSGIANSDVLGILGAMSVAAAETDGSMSPGARAAVESLLMTSGRQYQVVLYAGTEHGFGVRANMSNPRSKWAKEAAFGQAVSWFNAWA